MRLQAGQHLAYTREWEAWYAPALRRRGEDVRQVLVSSESDEHRGVDWQFTIREEGRFRKRLTLSGDLAQAWEEAPELERLAGMRTLEDAARMIAGLGGADATMRERP